MFKKNFKFVFFILMLVSSLYLYAQEVGEVLEDQVSQQTGQVVKTGPVITKIQAQYNNNQWELFIYWNNFWKDIEQITLSISPEWKDEINIKIEWVYNSIINSSILDSFENWEITVNVKDANWEFVSSNSVYFDFKLPSINKIYTDTILWPWEYITIEWENFRKPSYWTMWGNKYICEEESSTLCKFKISAEDDIAWKIWISSFWFISESSYELSNKKVPDIDVLWTSSNLFVVKIKNFDFKQLRKIPETKKEQDAKKIEARNWVKMVIDGKDFTECEINTNNELSCIWKVSIYYKWVWYVEIFWSKSPLFPYEIEDAPLVTKYKTYRKWWTLQTRDPATKLSTIIKWNILHFEIWLSNFNYSKKDNLSIFINWKEYSVSDKNMTLEKNNAIIKLNQLPDNQWEIYLKNKSQSLLDATEGIVIQSNIIPYDIWKYLPEIYEIWTYENENEFYIKWNNLTNFDNLQTTVHFWDISLSSNAIEQEAKKTKDENIKRISDAQSKLEAAVWNDINELNLLISSLKSINNDIDNWIYERSISQRALKIWEIINKSDVQIAFKAFDNDEYWKMVEKWEYKVYVYSNWKDSNSIDFFFNPTANLSVSYPYPVIEKIDYINWVWNTTSIKLKWQFLQFVKEIFFWDEKVKILNASGDSLVVSIPEYIQKKWPITAKLINNKLTNTLYVYEFFENLSNQIDINWQRAQNQEDEIENKEPILIVKNLYKNAIIKNLKLYVSSDLYENDKLPFYKISLKQWSEELADWFFKSNNLILFENVKLEKTIEVDELKDTELRIDFLEVDNAYWDYKIKLVDIEFYDETQIPNLIPVSKISFEKEPFYYVIEPGDTKLCIEKIESSEWLKCWEAKWLTWYENWIFEQEAFKSINAPAKNNQKRALFSDIHTSDWYYVFVEDLFQRWVIQGYQDRSFRGQANITRWEAIKILITTIWEIVPEYNSKVESFAFEDVDEDYWGRNMLEYAVRRDFLRPSKNFRPNKFITRAESAKLIIKFFNRTALDSYNNYFKDTSNHWVKVYSQYLYEAWVISWVSNENIFNPEWLVTRAEFSKMISKSIWIWAE